MYYRCAGVGLAAAALVVAAPLAAQTTDTGTTAPPRDPQTKPTVSPEQVIGVIKGMIKPKPSPTAFPTPTPTFQATATPTAVPTLYPAPTPRPVPTTKPAGVVSPSPTLAPQPGKVEPAASAATGTTPTPLATVAEPLPQPSVPVAEPLPADLSGPAHGPTLPWGLLPWWVWLIVAGAAGGLAELARRWFWPRPTIGCEIAVGPGALTHASHPVFTAPEINLAIRIETGEASAPVGTPVLAQGDAT
ncbi:hypothetical protein [Novosphingobium sp.]|uniref:hypothetical protein n=1 Tax=Novosphingobium sp. TaxID=1874826 RepID=UPI00286AA44D|nr:hypothetical protein [Novosphingobium sp.]